MKGWPVHGPALHRATRSTRPHFVCGVGEVVVVDPPRHARTRSLGASIRGRPGRAAMGVRPPQVGVECVAPASIARPRAGQHHLAPATQPAEYLNEAQIQQSDRHKLIMQDPHECQLTGSATGSGTVHGKRRGRRPRRRPANTRVHAFGILGTLRCPAARQPMRRLRDALPKPWYAGRGAARPRSRSRTSNPMIKAIVTTRPVGLTSSVMPPSFR
jgi:hypothetical protein